MKSAFYLTGLTAIPGRGLGHYGITASLDGGVAKALLNERREDKAPLIRMLEAELRGNKERAGLARLSFVGDSWLLRHLMLPDGNCACFGIDGMRLDSLNDGRDVSWHSHNIDSPNQAMTLASVWLLWINTLAAMPGPRGESLIEFPHFM